MPNTIIDHTFAGKPKVRETESSFKPISVLISDEDPDSAQILVGFQNLQQLDGLIHGLEAIRRDVEEREREAEDDAEASAFIGIGAATSSGAGRPSTSGG